MWKTGAQRHRSQMEIIFSSSPLGKLRDQGQALVEFTLIFILLVALSWIPAEFGLASVLVSDFPESEEGPDYWTASTDQVLVTANRQLFDADAIRSVATAIAVPSGFRVWTDDFNNLLRVLK